MGACTSCDRALECSRTARAFTLALIVNCQVAVSLRYTRIIFKLTLTVKTSLNIISDMVIPEQYEVLGPDELIKVLGYTRSTVYTYISRERWDRIPPPSRRLAMGPVWYRGDVEAWLERRNIR